MASFRASASAVRIKTRENLDLPRGKSRFSLARRERRVRRKTESGLLHRILKDAGYEPELIKSYGFAPLPKALNNTRGRREVEELTGNRWVPTLVLDDGTVIDDSREIVAWAEGHPA